MRSEVWRVIGLTAGVIVLAGIAAWMGLAHGCEQAGSGVIAGQVVLDPKLTDRVRQNAVLFIIVRRPQGVPRPIAVKRVDSPRFPVAFEISAADVMMEGTELRGMVEVLARLDRDGQAGPPQAGDLEGRFEKNPTLVGAQDVQIVLDKEY
jgi:cytochrome c-type biogenesis protein CcmH